VSLVAVEQQKTFTPGPPVRQARSLVAPSVGPRLLRVDPARLGGDQVTEVTVGGLTAGTAFTLAADPADPVAAPAAGWPMQVVEPTRAGVRLRLPRPDLAPGVRRLDAVTRMEGLAAGSDAIAVTVVPTVLSHSGTVRAGQTVTLTTAHTASDTTIHIGGARAVPSSVTPTEVQFVVPAVPSGTQPLMLRSRQVAGPGYELQVLP
jgi:hypothetical protein